MLKSHVMKYTLLGFPLSHSKSPSIHARLFEMRGAAGEYSLTESKSISDVIEKLKEFDGFNVTIPHKTAIIPYLDELTPEAQKFMSVNTVKNVGGRLIGHNTDGYGFLKSVLKVSALNKKVILLGSGGVARTVARICLDNGADLQVVVRDENSESARSFGDTVRAVTDRPYDLTTGTGHTLLINSTPVGMYPNEDEMPVSEEVIKNCGAVFDLVAKPNPTKLVKTAWELGIPAAGGAEMLVLQAAEAHKFWYGAEFSDEEIKSIEELL